MAKLLWEINRPGGYGVQREVVANTRSAAIAIAESEWLKENYWMNELDGTVSDDGTPFVRSPIPTFTAKKISSRISSLFRKMAFAEKKCPTRFHC